MPSRSTRRAFLRSAAAAGSAGLAGCSGVDRPVGSGGITPAPVPSDSPTAPRTPVRRDPPSAADLGFWVDVLDGSSETGPARLEISLWNAGDRPLTALDGSAYVVPFVDDDYAGVHPSGRAELLLIPVGSGLRVDPPDGPADRIEAYLPGSPSDGCWRVTFDWPGAQVRGSATLHAVTLEPGHIRRHPYELYFVAECLPGTFRFEHTFDLAAGDPPHERDLHRAALRFTVLVTPAMDVQVDVHEPVIGSANGGGRAPGDALRPTGLTGRIHEPRHRARGRFSRFISRSWPIP